MADRTMTDAQKQALDEVDSLFDRAFAQAAGRVGSIREGDNDSFGHCLRCDCEFFVAPTRPGLKCARPGCGHLFPSHDVF